MAALSTMPSAKKSTLPAAMIALRPGAGNAVLTFAAKVAAGKAVGAEYVLGAVAGALRAIVVAVSPC